MNNNWDPDKESFLLRLYTKAGVALFATTIVFLVIKNAMDGLPEPFLEGAFCGFFGLLIFYVRKEHKHYRERAAIIAKFSAGKPPSGDLEHYS